MRPSFSGRPGRWFLGLLRRTLSPASGCTPSSTILTVLLLATRRVSWPVAFLKPMVLTIMRHSRLWRASAPSVSSSLSLWISPGRFISWTCPMPSFTETSLRRYLWSNRLGNIAQGESSEVCLLKKAIYGLKQSPRAWFHKFSQLLFSYGFVSTVSDPTVMRKPTPHGCVILAVYVDDIIITGSDDAEVAATKAYLAQHFVTRDLSPPRYFLGLEIAYRPGQMSICQRKYVLDLLKETGMMGCNPASSPIEQNVDWWDNATALLEDAGLYRRLVGKLIFLTVTRPDISYAVSVLSQFM